MTPTLPVSVTVQRYMGLFHGESQRHESGKYSFKLNGSWPLPMPILVFVDVTFPEFIPACVISGYMLSRGPNF